MFKIVGYRHNEGEFSGRAYHNIDFEFICNENSSYTGYSTSYRGLRKLSVSSAKLKEVTGFSTPDELLNKNIRPIFDIGYEGKAKIVRFEILPDTK